MTAFAMSLDRLVSIQRQSGEDELGQQLPTGWVEFDKAWAGIRTLRGIEAIKAGAVASRVSASIRVRYREDVTAAMRIVDGANVYDVKAVMLDTVGRRHVDLVCEVIT